MVKKKDKNDFEEWDKAIKKIPMSKKKLVERDIKMAKEIAKEYDLTDPGDKAYLVSVIMMICDAIQKTREEIPKIVNSVSWKKGYDQAKKECEKERAEQADSAFELIAEKDKEIIEIAGEIDRITEEVEKKQKVVYNKIYSHHGVKFDGSVDVLVKGLEAFGCEECMRRISAIGAYSIVLEIIGGEK